MSGKARARQLFVAALVLWPMVHMVLSRSGKFSAWRFGGWGMYATPYPSQIQHPLSVLVELSAAGCEGTPFHPATVLVGAADVSRWLDAHAGLSFFVRCDTPSTAPIQLGETEVLSRLAEEAKAARQLERAEHLEALGRLIDARLASSAAEPYKLYVSIGDLRANPLVEKYGVEHQVFAYTGRLESGPVLFTPGL
jgi:hypothetical protein